MVKYCPSTRGWGDLQAGIRGWIILDEEWINFVVTNVIERQTFNPKDLHNLDAEVKYTRHVEVCDIATGDKRTITPSDRWYTDLPKKMGEWE